MEYSSKTVKELRNIAKENGMVGYSRRRKADLVAFVSCEKNIISHWLKEINSIYKMDYSSKTVRELRNIAKEKGMVGYSRLRKAELVAFVSSRSTHSVITGQGNNLVDSPVPTTPVPTTQVPASTPSSLKPSSTLWGRIFKQTKAVVSTFTDKTKAAINKFVDNTKATVIINYFITKNYLLK